MEHTAKLPLLPIGVQFPPELEGKIAFDAAKRRLIWRGFMTEHELQQLLQLHEDLNYRKAVADLFERCNRLETPFTRRLNLAVTLLVAMCLLAAAIIFVELQRSTATHAPSSSVPLPSESKS